MRNDVLDRIGRAFWAEHVQWSVGLNARGDAYDITRNGRIEGSAGSMQEARAQMIVLRRRASVRAILNLDIITATDDVLPILRQRDDWRKTQDKLLPALIKRYQYVPSDFLQAVVNGKEKANGIELDEAIAILKAREICAGRALTED